MKAHLTIFALAAAISIARAADKPVDLTGADASEFNAHLGQTVILRGRLESCGMHGPCLHGATPTNVVFYVIGDPSIKEAYFQPKVWTILLHQQVRLTGELEFHTFDRSKGGDLDQPPDYYYMVMQRTKLEREESK